jgi:hypothetical protein
MRTMFKSPNVHRNLEENVKRLEAWREKTAPGSLDALRQMMATMSADQAKAQAK